MSADGGGREVAYRMFAAEYDGADYSYSESDEERAPNYVVTPAGARVNRLFVVGVLTEVESVSDDVLRARVADSTGAFVLYAGQYQPDEQAFLEAADPPAFVAVTGKARTFQPEDGDRVFTSVRPESINEVDADTRDRWTVQAAEQTIERIGHAATALSTGLSDDQLRGALSEEGMSKNTVEGISIALDHYGTTPAYLAGLRDVALDSVRVVAGERDGVRSFDRDPDDAGDVTPDTLVSEAAAVSQVERAQTSEQRDATATTSETASGDSSASTDETTVSDSTASTDETTVSDSTPADETTAGGEAEPTVKTSDEPAAESDVDAGTGADIEDPGDFDANEFELEAETREEIESEYGTDFQTGTEVDEPGEADIDTPAADDDAGPPVAGAEEPADDEPADDATANDGEPPAADETAADGEPPTDDEEQPAADEGDEGEPPEDTQAALLDVMAELDEGDGADREALLAEMSERYGLDADAVEDAIQGALMDGQCYEPDDSSLKPI
jgi:RPA family protein